MLNTFTAWDFSCSVSSAHLLRWVPVWLVTWLLSLLGILIETFNYVVAAAARSSKQKMFSSQNLLRYNQIQNTTKTIMKEYDIVISAQLLCFIEIIMSTSDFNIYL